MSNLVVLKTRSSAEVDAAQLFMVQEASFCKHQVESLQVEDWMLAATYRSDSPLSGRRAYEDDRWSAVFVGDVVEHALVPFQSILNALDTGDWQAIAHLNGIFALAAYDRSMGRVVVASVVESINRPELTV